MDTYMQFKTFLENLAGYVETYRSVTSSSTLAADDYRKTLLVDSGSAVTLTIPTHASVPFEIGAVIPITHIGTGSLTIEAAVGVTINQRFDSFVSAGQWAELAIRKIATNTWILMGDLLVEDDSGDDAPELTGATIEADGETLTLIFDEIVEVGAGGNGGFTVDATGGAATLTYASGSGSDTLVYDISRVILTDETVTVSYDQPGDGIEDETGNDLADFEEVSCTNESEEIEDTTPPTRTSAVIGTAGNALTIGFSENITVGGGGNGGFAISPSGGAATLTYVSGSGTNSLVYSLSRTIESDETATLAYTQPGNGIEDSAGNDLANFSGASVTNDSTIGEPVELFTLGDGTDDGNKKTFSYYQRHMFRFTNDSACTVTEVDWIFKGLGTIPSTGNIVVELWSVSGAVQGSLISASSPIARSTFTSGLQTKHFTGLSAALSSATEYYAVVRSTVADTDDDNGISPSIAEADSDIDVTQRRCWHEADGSYDNLGDVPPNATLYGSV